MAPKRTTPVHAQLLAARTATGLTQTEFARKYFKTGLRTYQRWEGRKTALPGPVQVILAALRNGGKLPD